MVLAMDHRSGNTLRLLPLPLYYVKKNFNSIYWSTFPMRTHFQFNHVNQWENLIHFREICFKASLMGTALFLKVCL